MWILHEGTITGPHHERRGEENQDAYASKIIEGPDGSSVIMVAADGAGSLPNSGEGAALIVECLTQLIEAAVLNGVRMDAAAMEDVFTSARETFLAVEDYQSRGCTAAAAYVTKNSWCVGVLGDAFVVLHHSLTDHVFLQPEQQSEFANITELFSSPKIHPLFLSGEEELYGVSVSSDGLEGMSVERGEPVAGFWSNLLQHMRRTDFQMEEFLMFLRGKDLLGDDTTLVTSLREEVGADE